MNAGNVDVLDAKVESANATAQGLTTWKLDPSHSSAGFSVKHMMITNVRGEFKDVEGTLQFDPKNIENSSVQITIKTDSITTLDDNRDAHLKSEDFFDVAKHADMTFRSTEFKQKDLGELLVKGDLTIRGTTKEVVLTVEGPSDELKDPWGGTRIAFTATTKIKRKDFGLNWNVALEAGGILVGDEVKISVDAQFVKQ